MSVSTDRWFEVWFDEGEHTLPTWLLIVIPDPAHPGLAQVYDPFEKRVVHQGETYEDTCIWLAEDEYSLVNGRVFPEDGLPLATGKNR